MTGLAALGAAACALAACSSHGAAPAPASSGQPLPTSASSVSPEARARAFLQQQIAAALRHDGAALHATFSGDAIVLTPSAGPPAEASFAGIGGGGADGVAVTKATIAKLVAEGTADAVWFYAEVATGSEGPADGETVTGQGTTRVVELLAASESWRAVAASFTTSREPQPSGDNAEVPGATASDGPLAQLAAEPRELARMLAPNAIAVGPTAKQLAIGGSKAREALVAWNLEPLSLYQRAREVRRAGWGFVQATLDHPTPDKLVDRLSVQLFAVPAGGGDRWRVVLAQYLAQ